MGCTFSCCIKLNRAAVKTSVVTKDDIRNVAKDINVELTEKEVEWVLLCYEDAQRQDPSGTWNLVVEDLVHQAVNFRKYSDNDTLLNFMG